MIKSGLRCPMATVLALAALIVGVVGMAGAEDPAPPQLARASPNRVDEGDILKLEGNNLAPTGGGTVSVSFAPAGTLPVAVSGSDGEIFVEVPVGAETGLVTVTVTHLIDGSPVAMTGNAIPVFVINKELGNHGWFVGSDDNGLYVASQSGGTTAVSHLTHKGALSPVLMSDTASRLAIDPLARHVYGTVYSDGTYSLKNLTTNQTLLQYTWELGVWAVSMIAFDAAGDLVVAGGRIDGHDDQGYTISTLGMWRFLRSDWAGGAQISLDPSNSRSLLSGGAANQLARWGDLSVSGDGTVYAVWEGSSWDYPDQIWQFPGRDGVSPFSWRELPPAIGELGPGNDLWSITADPCGSGVFGLNPFLYFTEDQYEPPVPIFNLETNEVIYTIPQDPLQMGDLIFDKVGNLFVSSYYLPVGSWFLYWLKPDELPGGFYEALSCDDWDLGCVSCSAEDGAGNGCVGAPIRLANGNMRLSEHDPLPAAPANLATRVYDSQTANAAGEFPKRDLGVLGRGWTSVFDSSLSIAGSFLHFTTEEGNRISFLDTGSGLVQVAPRGGAAAAAWFDGFCYRLRQARADLVRVYAGTRLIAFESVATGRRADITYDDSGLPASVTDSWHEWAWTITTANGRIQEIQTNASTWDYVYVNGYLSQVLTDGEIWREYGYDPRGNLTEVRDSAGIIERHSYEEIPPYRALTSQTADESITIEYNAETSLPRPRNVDQHETAIRVWHGTDPQRSAISQSSTVYYLRPIAGKKRTVEVRGSCSCGAGDHTVYGFDGSGHVVREQGADLSVTIREWEGGPNARLTAERRGYKKAGCGSLPGAEDCRLDADTIMSVELEPSSATTHTWHRYDDPSWPDRATSSCRESVVRAGEESCQSFTYDPVTGATLSTRHSGWTLNSSGQAVIKSPITQRAPYGASEPAAFNPLDHHTGISFQASWATEPQPVGMLKLINGPIGDLVLQDHTSFVYYPLAPGVPDALRGRLAAQMDPVGNVTVYDAYDAHGNVTRSIDASGVVTERQYDDLGRLVTTTLNAVPGCNTAEDPLCKQGLTTQYEYLGTSNLLHKVTGATGSVVVYGYDQWRRQTTISRGPSESDLREQIQSTYNSPSWGKRDRESINAWDSGSWQTKKFTDYDYDDQGRLTMVTYPGGSGCGRGVPLRCRR